MAALIIVSHEVKELDAWKNGFDAQDESRNGMAAAGVVGAPNVHFANKV